jgi:hypothetical protein
MTNNPTIDGVSLATIEKGFDYVEGIHVPTIKISFAPCRADDNDAWNARDAVSEKIRAMLDDPVVERQPNAYIVEAIDPNSGHIRRRGLHWHSTETLKGTRDFQEWAGENAIKEQALYTAPPEVAALQSTLFDAIAHGDDGHRDWLKSAIDAHFSKSPLPEYVPSGKDEKIDALQSTIAQLQARIAELKDGIDKHWKVVCDQRSRIAELESGRGEPIKTPDMPYKMLPLEEDGWFQCVNAYEAMYPLFTASYAPIAQQLDQPTAYLRNEGVPNNLVVCGFDHPDEFKVFKAPPAPVVLPERAEPTPQASQRYHGELEYCQGWNACLDATAALNEVRK